MKNILLIIVITLCFSCGIRKNSTKNKEDRTLTESTETVTKRKGDTVTYTIPNVILKDTTIYTVNREGTTLRTTYNSQGQISQIDCFASMIEEITKSNRQLVEAIKEKDKEKEETVSPMIVLYFMVGLALIVLVVGFFAYKTLNKNSAAINSIINKL